MGVHFDRDSQFINMLGRYGHGLHTLRIVRFNICTIPVLQYTAVPEYGILAFYSCTFTMRHVLMSHVCAASSHLVSCSLSKARRVCVRTR